MKTIKDNFKLEPALLDNTALYLQTILDKELKDNDYLNIIGNAINKLELVNTIKNAPYGFYGPLSRKGGLLVHIYQSVQNVLSTFKYYDPIYNIGINKDLAILGCILRNIGWATTTYFDSNGKLQANDAHVMIGLEKAAFRYINHLIISTESDLEITIPEAKKQALENLVCQNENDIKTLEGKIVWHCDKMTDLLHFGSYTLTKIRQQDLFVKHNV